MKNFKHMVNHAKYKGFKAADGLGGIRETSLKEKNHFWDLVEEAKIFVISIPENVEKINLLSDSEKIPTAPFPVCFFEFSFVTEVPGDGGEFSLLGVLIEEVSPGNNDLYCFVRCGNSPPIILYYPHTVSRNSESFFDTVAEGLFHHLDTSAFGVENIKQKVRFRRPEGDKSIRLIDKVIHVTPKKYREHVKPLFSQLIDWTHRWSVRGHWRRAEGTGKNREGDYCVRGFTWVTDHIKGPESLPVVQKIRLVG
jgi:hypothetical protein